MKLIKELIQALNRHSDELRYHADAMEELSFALDCAAIPYSVTRLGEIAKTLRADTVDGDVLT